MSENATTRRGVCRTLLAIGGLAVAGIARAQSTATQPTTAVGDDSLTDQRVADAVRRGASMEEIAKLREPAVRTPEEALRMLKAGNARFFGARPDGRNSQRPSAERRFLGSRPSQ